MQRSSMAFAALLLLAFPLSTPACSSPSGSSTGSQAGSGGTGPSGSSGSSASAGSMSGTGGATAGTGGAGGNASGGAAGAGGGSTPGGTGGVAPGSVTSIAGDKALSALTPDEATQLCNDSYTYFGTAIPKAVACKWQGLSYAASSSAPTQEKLRQNCSDHETSCQSTVPWAINSGCSGLPATCQATVAAYSACMKAEAEAFTQTVGPMPACDTITSESTAAIFEAMAASPPADCESLVGMCPELTPPNPTNN